MNKIRHFERAFAHLRPLNALRVNGASARRCCTSKDSDGEKQESSQAGQAEAVAETASAEDTRTSDVKLSGFARSFEKFVRIDDPKEPEKPQTFASLIRNSKFVDLGNPVGKIVTGKVFHVVDDDLYIDFGWKFHCVCRKPMKNGQYYVRGAKVRLRIKELELSSKFLGAATDVTLLEADCTLMGLIWSPLRMAEEKMRTRRPKPEIVDELLI